MRDERQISEARRIAASYPSEARFVPEWERKRYFTEMQQLGWMLRFDPDAAEEVLSADYSSIGSVIRQDRCRPSAASHRTPHHG